jgi:OmpA-OmpF porin, OOP family
MTRRVAGAAVLAVLLPLAAAAQENYLGILKPPRQATVEPVGAYAFSSPLFGLTPRLDSDTGYRLKLGYKYSRYFAVEGELVDTGPAAHNPFASPGALTPSFRSTGFGVDTVATLPLWRFSFYGKLGAFRGDGRSNGFSTYNTSLFVDPTRGTKLRAGLGLRYDFTRTLGVRAELERQAPLGSSPNEGEADQFSVGVSWRF